MAPSGSSPSPAHARKGPDDSPTALTPYLHKVLHSIKDKSEVGYSKEHLRAVLGELIAKGNKGEKELDYVVLPRLALYGAPAVDTVPAFVRLLENADGAPPRVTRYAYYFLGAALSAEAALASSQHRQDPRVEAAVKALARDASGGGGGAAPPRQAAALVALARAAVAGSAVARRALRGVLEGILANLSEGREKKKRMNLVKNLIKSTTSKSAAPALPDPLAQRAAFAAIRATCPGDEDLQLAALQSSRCTDAVAVRHALAVAARLAVREPALVAERLLATVKAAAAAVAAGGGDGAAMASPRAPPAESKSGGLVLADSFARVHLVHVCGAVVHCPELQHPAQAALRAPYWAVLEGSALHGATPLMLEAVRALAGAAPRVVAPAARVRAWERLQGPAGGGAAGGGATLLAALVTKLEGLVQGGNQPTQSSACRAAGALAEAHAHWEAAHAAEPPRADASRAALASLARALQVAMTSKNFSIRAAALGAVVWLHTPTFLPGLVAAVEEQFQAADWPTEAVSDMMTTLRLRLVATPALSAELLAMVYTLVQCAPDKVVPAAVLELWQAALTVQVDKNKTLTLSAALDMLGMLHAPAASDAEPDSGGGGATHGRAAVWFLGENANFAVGEFAWANPGDPATLAAFQGLRKRVEAAAMRGGDGWDEDVAAAATQRAAARPLLVRVVAALHRCALTGAYSTRMEAVHALSKIALRSGEPFRLQCCAALSALLRANLGLAADVSRSLAVVRQVYDAQEHFLQAVDMYGTAFASWDAGVLRRFASVHERLLLEVDTICFVPPQLYLPLGALSAGALQEARARLNQH